MNMIARDNNTVLPQRLPCCQPRRFRAVCLIVAFAALLPGWVGAGAPATLLEAVQADDVPAARQFISAGAGLEARDAKGWTPLIIALNGPHAEMARLLVEKGADVNAKSASAIGNTALCWAAQSNDPALIDLMLQHGADLNARSRNGMTALYVAVMLKKERAAEHLISKGARIDQLAYLSEGKHLFTPLMCAVSAGNVRMVDLLLKHGANLEKKNNLGRTALFFAVGREQSEMLKHLIARGASVKARGPRGETALILAVNYEDAESVKILLAAGADPFAEIRLTDDPEEKGKDGVWHATVKRNPEIAALVREAQQQKQ
jgi:ankyrin repeat protein